MKSEIYAMYQLQTSLYYATDTPQRSRSFIVGKLNAAHELLERSEQKNCGIEEKQLPAQN